MPEQTTTKQWVSFEDLDKTILGLFEQSGLPDPLAQADITFLTPDQDFEPAIPTVNLFMYRVEENLMLRNNERSINRNGGQAYIQTAPMRVACSYLVTAWAGGNTSGEQITYLEHQLLSQALQLLGTYPTIPPQFYVGSMVDQDPLLPARVAQPEEIKLPSEFWSALNQPIRPAFTFQPTVSMPMFPPAETDVVSTMFSDYQQGTGGESDRWLIFGGQVINSDDGVGVPNAKVTLDHTLRPGATLETFTDTLGNYLFRKVLAGDYTASAQANGYVAEEKTMTVPGSWEDYKFELQPQGGV